MKLFGWSIEREIKSGGWIVVRRCFGLRINSIRGRTVQIANKPWIFDSPQDAASALLAIKGVRILRN